MLTRFSRILVVDDNATVRTLIGRMFQSLGHVNVDVAADGLEAMVKLDDRAYALIVCDWFLEPMSGLELLLKVRRSDRLARTLFIMVTTRRQKKFMEVPRDAGATHYLAKPFTADDLRARISVLRLGETVRPREKVTGVRRRSMA